MAIASNLGFPRIGYNRQLKQVTEKYWAGKASLLDLLDTGKALRSTNWKMQKKLALSKYQAMIFLFMIIFLILPSCLVSFPNFT